MLSLLNPKNVPKIYCTYLNILLQPSPRLGRTDTLHRAEARSAFTRIPPQPKGAVTQERLGPRGEPRLDVVQHSGEVRARHGGVLCGVNSECSRAELQQADWEEEG